jgi:hypothetical protein
MVVRVLSLLLLCYKREAGQKRQTFVDLCCVQFRNADVGLLWRFPGTFFVSVASRADVWRCIPAVASHCVMQKVA